MTVRNRIFIMVLSHLSHSFWSALISCTVLNISPRSFTGAVRKTSCPILSQLQGIKHFPERFPLFASFQNWSWKWIREFYPHFFLVELRGPLRWQPSLISKSTRGYPAAPVYAQECRACREQFRVLLSSDAQHYAFYAELQAPGPG